MFFSGWFPHGKALPPAQTLVRLRRVGLIACTLLGAIVGLIRPK
jgi:hypothetical protein